MSAEIFGKLDEVGFLAFPAFEPVGAAVQRDTDLTHGTCPQKSSPALPASSLSASPSRFQAARRPHRSHPSAAVLGFFRHRARRKGGRAPRSGSAPAP